MFSETEMEQILAVMHETGVRELTVEGQDGYLRLALPSDAAVTPATPAAAPAPQTVAVKSRGMGVFIACGQDDGLEEVEAGTVVRKGQVLGYTGDDGARLPLVAEADGTVLTAPDRDNRLVGYGDILFELEAE